jgi:ribonuclease P protein component
VRLEIQGKAMNASNRPEEKTPAEIQSPPPDRPRKDMKPTLAGVRLRKHADYQRAYAAARKRQSASTSWFVAARAGDDGESEPGLSAGRVGLTAGRVGLTAGRVGLTAGKVLGKAHERNRIKRRMREALRRHVDLLPEGVDLILHPRRTVLTMEFAKLDAEIVRILTQARAEAERFASGRAVAQT